ncbi:hypothetical protein Tco_0742883 [Tanacetum coccineum]
MDKSRSYLNHDKHQVLFDGLPFSWTKPTKRSRTKESKPSKKSSTSKDSSKGKSPAKTSKFGKSMTTKEPVAQPVFEMASDDIEQAIDDFKQPPRPPIRDQEWNKRQVVIDQPEHPWFNNLVSAAKDPLTFNELMVTLIDFTKYAMNRLKIDNLTQAHLVEPVYELLKDTCTSSIELEYHMEECFKELTDKLDWNNPEGDRCPFDLTKPLPLKDPKKKYTTSITKTKAAWYEILGIEDMVPTLWSTTKVRYNKDAEKGIKHLGERRQLWYRSQINKVSNHNVYTTQKILTMVGVSVKKLHGYGHLEEIMVRRVDRQLYKFKEGDFVDLHLNDIEDMLLFNTIEDLQLGVESYQKKLNITKPQKTFLGIEVKELYTPSFDPPGAVYEDLNKQTRVMRVDELYKF